VVPVDGVLALLGEALALMGQTKRIFGKEQVFTLLRVVEDFATAPSRIRENAESLLKASVKAYHEGGNGGSVASLKKSRSTLTQSSSGATESLGGSYDLLASSTMMTRSKESEVKRSGVLAGEQRGWDWRRGLEGLGAVEAGEKEVLGLVRIALAQEVAKGWTSQIGW
jgi:hypothetical protein